MINLGLKLRELINSKGIRISHIAVKACVPRTTLSTFLNGHSELKSDALVRLLKVLNIDIENQIKSQLEQKH